MTSSSTPANTALRAGIIILTFVTAIIHLTRGDLVLILNGLGYLALLAALYLPVPRVARYRNVVRWVLVGYTALSIFAWILLGARTPIGYADKAIEVALILLLLIDARHSRA